jgi:hypothetical protein
MRPETYRPSRLSLRCPRVPPPSAYDTEDELLRACNWEISEALYNRGDMAQRNLACFYFEGVDGFRDMARSEVEWVYDSVARDHWNVRLTERGV